MSQALTSTPEAVGAARGPRLRWPARAPARPREGALPRGWLVFAAWTLLGLFLGLRHHALMLERGAGGSWGKTLFIWIICYWIWAAFTPAIVAMVRRFPLTRERWVVSVPAHFAAGTLLAVLRHALATVLLLPLTWSPPLGGGPVAVFRVLLLAEVQSGVVLYWGVVGTVLVVAHYRRYQEQALEASRLQLRMSRLEANLTQARLDALRLQLQPHFLFNTLNTVGVLMAEDVERAQQVLLRLSDLLRATLSQPAHCIPLREELQVLEHYLEIERTRFQGRLRLALEVEPAAEEALVPAFLLQPIVENALRHAIAPGGGSGVVTIRATRDGDEVVLEVADNGPGMEGGAPRTRGAGIGLANTRARLEQLYPAQHDLAFLENPGGGLLVRIVFPIAPRLREVAA